MFLKASSFMTHVRGQKLVFTTLNKDFGNLKTQPKVII